MNEEVKALELAWQRLLYQIKPLFERKPNLQSMLFLIGVQELGQLHQEFTKEEKEDLMHIAICTLMEQEGYYEFSGRDEDGWPHFDRTHKSLPQDKKKQERLLKKQIIQYFENSNTEEE